MKQRNWFKPKAFTHLTAKLSLSDAKWVKEYVADASKVAKHKFYPLIHRTIVTKRFKTGIGINNELIKKHYTYKNGNKQSTAKYREIYYANHLDSHIYAYYAQRILEPLYEEKLRENAQLNESVIAYRRISLSDNSRCKCNIDFANEVFDLIKLMKGETAVIALDISRFFDSLDHKKLKTAWAKLLNRTDLPKDHYNLYKNVTSFSFVELKDLLKEFNHKHSNQLIQKEVNQFVESGEEFRKRIKEKKLIKQNPFRRCENDGSKTKIGIPQGTPISAFLANLYLLQFDKQILELVKDTSTVYRRYSDDILIICPKEDFEKLESKAYELIEHYNLIIQSSKTQRSFFFNGKLLKGQKPVNYLGFQFDGNRKLLKSVSISKFYRKVKRNVKYRAVRALVARKKRDAGVVVDATLHRRKLYEQFSFKGKAKSSIKKRNFFSYVYFASRVMKSDHIKNQLSGSWNILHKEIDRYEKKFKLDKIQKRSQKLILKVLHSEQDE